MKRKLSLLMAFMMAATLIPAQPASAASKNVVNKVVSAVSDNTLDGTTGVTLTLAADGASVSGPQAGETFELQLSGDAEWTYDDKADTSVTGAKVRKMTSNILRVTVDSTGTVTVPMLVKLNGSADGAQKVTVITKDSSVSGGEYTYATIGASSIKLRVQKKEKIARSGETLIPLILDEATNGAFAVGDEITLRLPKDFAWDLSKAKTTDNAEFTVESTDDDRILKIKIKTADVKLESIYANIAIVPGRDARYGDVDVTVGGNAGSKVSPSSLVVAEYVAYGVEVKAEKVLNVIAGKDEEGKYKSKITIQEPASSSLQGKRYMEFKFVDENGKAVDASLQDSQTLKLTKKTGGSDTDLQIDGTSVAGGVKADKYAVTVKTYKKDDNKKADKFDLYVNAQSTTSKAKYELEVPFVVASDFTGKLYLQVKGAGAEEQKVQIADVKAPVTFEVKGTLPQVRIGLQKQAGSDIVVKETEAGALQDYVPSGSADYASSRYAKYTIVPDENFGMTFKSTDVKVTEGNISLKDSGKKDREMFVEVDRKSTKASTLTFSNITVTLDRTVPYGDIKLKGNFGVVGSRHDLTNTVKKFDYFTTVTPVANDKRITTVFKIGEKGYTEVIDKTREDKQSEVAPFISKEGRTMLPVRYVANAIGATVNYDPTTRTATFEKNQIVVSIQIDKAQMYVNGSPVKLYSKPANVENRIFLPLANIAQAFGLKQGETIVWNQEAKTVTILPQDASDKEIKAAQDGTILDGTKAVTETKKEEPKKEETKTETTTTTPAK